MTRHVASLTSPYHVPEAHDKITRHTSWANKEKEEYDDEDEYAAVKTKRGTEAYTLRAAEDRVTQHWNCALKYLKTKNYVPWLDYFSPPYPEKTEWDVPSAAHRQYSTERSCVGGDSNEFGRVQRVGQLPHFIGL